MAGRKYLYLQQVGEGCDCSIGCGNRLWPLDSTKSEWRRAQVMAILSEIGAGSEEIEIKQAMILELIEDVMPVCQQHAKQVRQEIKEMTLAYKREELSRLKKELGEI